MFRYGAARADHPDTSITDQNGGSRKSSPERQNIQSCCFQLPPRDTWPGNPERRQCAPF
jgi:hypothetical protein